VRAAYSHLRRWEGKGVSMLAHGPVHLDTADVSAVQVRRRSIGYASLRLNPSLPLQQQLIH